MYVGNFFEILSLLSDVNKNMSASTNFNEKSKYEIYIKKISPMRFALFHSDTRAGGRTDMRLALSCHTCLSNTSKKPAFL